jgi:hypothetical protein
MALMLLGALAIAWTAAIVVVLALCIQAARADRAIERATRARATAPRPGLRMIA